MAPFYEGCLSRGWPGRFEGAAALIGVNVLRRVGRSTLTPGARRRGLAVAGPWPVVRAGAGVASVAAKKINGRNRHIALDTTGLVLDVVITPRPSRAATPPGRCYGTPTAPATTSAWSGPMPDTSVSCPPGRRDEDNPASRLQAQPHAFEVLPAAGPSSGPSPGSASTGLPSANTSTRPPTTKP
jgi:hypothetical protein